MVKTYDYTLPKDKYVQAIFDRIATQYDHMNGMMSLGIHHLWCKQLLELIHIPSQGKILDACCGTGFLTSKLRKKFGYQSQLNPRRQKPLVETIIGLDFSEAMLNIAKIRLHNSISINEIKLIQANATAIPFPDHSFDCITIAYGIRNVLDPKAFLKEIKRVTKPGGQVISLELVKPDLGVFQSLYKFYLHSWVPLLGKILTNDRDAYQYLHDSIFYFMDRHQLTALFQEIGFSQVRCLPLTLGIAAIHVGIKPPSCTC